MINVRGLCKKFDDFEALNNLKKTPIFPEE